MFQSILNFLKEVWVKLKKIFAKIISFFENIANWFKQRYLKVKQQRPDVEPIALKIKKELEAGNYNTLDLGLERDFAVVNTFYDRSTGKILDEHTEVVQSNQLDAETIKAFGDKDMLVLS